MVDGNRAGDCVGSWVGTRVSGVCLVGVRGRLHLVRPIGEEGVGDGAALKEVEHLA